MENIKILFKKINNKFLSINIESKFYSIAFVFFILFFLIGYCLPDNTTKNIIMMVRNILTIILICIGFTLQSISTIKKIWGHWIGKIIISFLNFITFFISKALSRILISDTFGLPVKDFEMTSEILTLTFYLPILFLLLSIVFIFLYLLQMIYISLQVELLKKVLAKFLSDLNLPFMVLIGRFFATFFISIFLWYAGNKILFAIADKSSFVRAKMIPFLAYWCDYQALWKYPNLRKGERVILHENGIISYIKYNDKGEMEISTEKYE